MKTSPCDVARSQGPCRRALSLIEVLLAAALMTVLIVPVFSLMRPSDVRVNAANSRASRLFWLADQRVARLGEGQLARCSVAGSNVNDGFRELDLARLLAGAPGGADGGGATIRLAAGLEVHLYARRVRHSHSRVGLDRLDVRMTYTDSRRPRALAHSSFFRDEVELAVLAHLRLTERNLDAWPDAKVAASIRSGVRWLSRLTPAPRKTGVRFAAPVFPGWLATFEERESGADAGEQQAEKPAPRAGAGGEENRDEGTGDSDHPFSRPRFESATAICL